MQIEIEAQNVPFPKHARSELKDRIRRRIGELSSRVHHLRITFSDVNGSKGGKGKMCKITAHTARGKTIVVTETNRTLPRAFFRALRRLRRLIGRRRARRVRLAKPLQQAVAPT